MTDTTIRTNDHGGGREHWVRQLIVDRRARAAQVAEMVPLDRLLEELEDAGSVEELAGRLGVDARTALDRLDLLDEEETAAVDAQLYLGGAFLG